MNILFLSAVLLVFVTIGYCIGRYRCEGKPIKSPPPYGSILYVRYIVGESYLAVCDGKLVYYQAVNYDAPVTTGFHRMQSKEIDFPFPDSDKYKPYLFLMDQSLFKPRSRTA
jgi:hypothetical protein